MLTRENLIDMILEAKEKGAIQKAVTRMKEKGTVGSFRAAAQKAGKSTCAYANGIMSGSIPASPALKKKANFAKNFGCKGN